MNSFRSLGVQWVLAALKATWIVALIPALLLGDNAVEDFSPTVNPSGAWSYGYSTSLDGAVILCDDASPAFPGYQSWLIKLSIPYSVFFPRSPMLFAAKNVEETRILPWLS